MAASRAPWALYGALAAADLVLAGLRTPATARLRRVTKPALMPVLALVSRRSAPGTATPVSRSVLAGLALSCVGDAVLLRPGPAAFLGGLSAFFGAHVAYLAGFRPRPDDPPVRLREWVGPVEVASLAGVPLLTAAAWRKDRNLAVPVAAYGLVINAMGWSAARLAVARPGPATRRLRRGARLFVVSDLLLGLGTFLTARIPAWLDVAVMATYVTAQGWIAAGASGDLPPDDAPAAAVTR